MSAVRAPLVMNLGRGALGGGMAGPVSSRLRPPASDSLSHLPDAGGGGNAKVPPQPGSICLVCGQRARPIAHRGKPLDQLALGIFREWVEGHLLARALQPPVEVTGGIGLIRQPTQHIEQLATMPLARLVNPVVVKVSK